MSIIPFNPNDAVIVVNMLVRGAKNSKLIKMVVDTGASITIIPSDIALAIGIDPSKPIKRIEIITASGTEYVPVVKIPCVQFLGFSLKNVDIACLNLPPRSTVSGLLGLNILKNFNLSFKFREGIIEINSPYFFDNPNNPDPKIEHAWGIESDKRITAFKKGKIKSIPLKTVKKYFSK